MLKEKIVVVTQESDSHADVIITKLKALGHEVVRFDTADIPTESLVSMGIGASGYSARLNIPKYDLNLDFKTVKSIWWRKPRTPVLPTGLTARENRFARQELTTVINGLWAALDCYWMSFPGKLREAGWKFGQLKLAAALGFDVPKTLITSDPDELRRFVKMCGGKVVFKVLSDPTLGMDMTPRLVDADEIMAAYTTLLTQEMIEPNIEKIKKTPCQFQEYIEKKHELRITVIGNQIFTGEIDSQKQERTKIDWRHHDVPILLRAGHLPQPVADKCLALVKRYGLEFSAIDIIVTPDDRYVFLESNPNGQWLFVEHLAPELRMTEALIKCLTAGCSN